MAQSIPHNSMTLAAVKISRFIGNKFKDTIFKKGGTVMVLPILEVNGQITEDSKTIAIQISQQLGGYFQKNNLDFTTNSYNDLQEYQKNEIIKKFSDGVPNATDIEKKKQWLNKVQELTKVDYIVSGNYLVDWQNNKFILETFEINNNWGNNSEKKRISIKVVDPCTVAHTKVGFRPIVPGLAQFYKKENAKGWGILASEVVCGAGIGLSYAMSNSYYTKAQQSRNTETRQMYNNYSDYWSYAAYGCIGLTAGIYLYNLIDAAIISKKGKNNAYSYKSKYMFYASADSKNVGITFKINIK